MKKSVSKRNEKSIKSAIMRTLCIFMVMLSVIIYLPLTSSAGDLEEACGYIVEHSNGSFEMCSVSVIVDDSAGYLIYCPVFYYNSSKNYSFVYSYEGKSHELELELYKMNDTVVCFKVVNESDVYVSTEVYDYSANVTGTAYVVNYADVSSFEGENYQDTFNVMTTSISSNNGEIFNIDVSDGECNPLAPVFVVVDGYYKLAGFFLNSEYNCCTMDAVLNELNHGNSTIGGSEIVTGEDTTDEDTSDDPTEDNIDTNTETKESEKSKEESDSDKDSDKKKSSESKIDTTLLLFIGLGLAGVAIVAFIIWTIAKNKTKNDPNAFNTVANNDWNIPQQNTQPIQQENDFDMASETIPLVAPDNDFYSVAENNQEGIYSMPTQPIDIPPIRIVGFGGFFDNATIEEYNEIIIGRDPNKCNCCYPLDEKGISAVHCMIENRDGHIQLTDLGSSYGTFLNGIQIEPNVPYELNDGDSFYLANIRNSFYYG